MCLFGTSSKVAGTWADITSSHCWLAGGGEKTNHRPSFPGALGRAQGQRGSSLCQSWEKMSPSRTEGEILVFSLMEPNSSAIGNSYKRRAMEKWEELQPWPGGSPPPASQHISSFLRVRGRIPGLRLMRSSFPRVKGWVTGAFPADADRQAVGLWSSLPLKDFGETG